MRQGDQNDGEPLVLLIHGSCFGGWCWQALRQELAHHGVRSQAPTLTALGNRAHLGSVETGLRAHVDDIAEYLHFVDHERIVLVGHSYGALVASEIAGDHPDRITDLVVMDGFLGVAGQSLYGAYPHLVSAFEAERMEARPGYLRTPSAAHLGLEGSNGLAQLLGRLRPMPEAANTEACRHSTEALTCRLHYLQFTLFPVFDETAARARQAGWNVQTLAAGHMGLITHPVEVAEFLVPIVDAARSG